MIPAISGQEPDQPVVEVQLDGLGWNALPVPGIYWSYLINSFLLTEGSHTISVRATDGNGIVSPVSTITFIIDQTVPSLEITYPAHGDNIKGNCLIEGTAYDTNSIEAVYINPSEGTQYFDTGGAEIWQYDFDSTQVTDGNRIISVMAFDTAGLYSITNIAVIIDNTAPELVIDNPVSGATISGDFTLSGTAADSMGLDRIEIKIGSNATDKAAGTTGWSYEIQAANLVIGENVIQVIAYDTAGNFTSGSLTIYYDNTPPVVTVASPAAASYQQGAAIIIAGTVTNLTAGDSVEINIDGNGFIPANFDGVNWTYTYNSLCPLVTGKEVAVQVRAADVTTYASHQVTRSFFVDNTDPIGTIASPQIGNLWL